MTKKKENYDFVVPWKGDFVPWECTGYKDKFNTLGIYSPNSWGKEIVWRENKPFKASFKLVEFKSQASSTKMVFENTANNEKFIIRSAEFVEALDQLAVVHGVFFGEWIFKKTADRYYGLKLYY